MVLGNVVTSDTSVNEWHRLLPATVDLNPNSVIRGSTVGAALAEAELRFWGMVL
jgi:hypothetical protein